MFLPLMQETVVPAEGGDGGDMAFWLPGSPSPAALGVLLSACRELDRAGESQPERLLIAPLGTWSQCVRGSGAAVPWHMHLSPQRSSDAPPRCGIAAAADALPSMRSVNLTMLLASAGACGEPSSCADMPPAPLRCCCSSGSLAVLPCTC